MSQQDLIKDIATQKPRRRGRLFRITLWLVIPLLVLLMLFVFGMKMLSLAQNKNAMAGIHQALDAAKPWLTLWRLSVIAILVTFWRTWVSLIARIKTLSMSQQATLIAARWKVCAWLVLIELVLVQALPAKFAKAVFNW